MFERCGIPVSVSVVEPPRRRDPFQRRSTSGSPVPYGGDQPSPCSDPSSIAAMRRWRTVTCVAPARPASPATARAISACSGKASDDDALSCLHVRAEPNRELAYRRGRSSDATRALGVLPSIAPIEVAWATGPERVVHGRALDVLERLLAGPREPLRAEL